MSKHTEGQWSIYVGENSEPIAIYAGDNRVTVCDFRIRSNRETLQADANLIAASPDLLEALEDILSVAEIHVMMSPDVPLDGPIGKARAAIDKARGES